MRYTHVVWDFDGTLADTLALALTTFNALADRHGFRRVADPVAARGLGTFAFLRQQGIPLWRLPRLMKDYLAAVRGHMGDVRLFDGMAAVLAGLKARGCRLGVLSSNAADNIRTCLRANAAEDAFAFVIGYPRLFGKARALRKLLRAEGVEPRRFLYVGDEVRDLEAAREVGVDFAAVTWGFHTAELLARHEPTYLWAAPGEVLAAVTSPPGPLP